MTHLEALVLHHRDEVTYRQRLPSGNTWRSMIPSVRHYAAAGGSRVNEKITLG